MNGADYRRQCAFWFHDYTLAELGTWRHKQARNAPRGLTGGIARTPRRRWQGGGQ